MATAPSNPTALAVGLARHFACHCDLYGAGSICDGCCGAALAAEVLRLRVELTEPRPAPEPLPLPVPPCAHEKVYSSVVLTANPPHFPWICRKCLAEGTDFGQRLPAVLDEYDELRKRKAFLTLPFDRPAP